MIFFKILGALILLFVIVYVIDDFVNYTRFNAQQKEAIEFLNTYNLVSNKKRLTCLNCGREKFNCCACTKNRTQKELCECVEKERVEKLEQIQELICDFNEYQKFLIELVFIKGYDFNESYNLTKLSKKQAKAEYKDALNKVFIKLNEVYCE